MRITGGTFRGRPIRVPEGLDVRPTQDRVREALFNMLQGVVTGCRFLDLFAGSGAVGLEALSRGAAEVTLVEQAPRHAACIERNIAALGAADRARLVRQDAYAWLSAGAPRGYGLVFADPPYALGAEKGYGDMLALLGKGVLAPDGFFITEMRRTQDPETVAHWEICRDRTYGQTRLVVYRPLGETA